MRTQAFVSLWYPRTRSRSTAVWRPGEDFGKRDTDWTRRFFAGLGRFREGGYVNFLGGDEDPAVSARRTGTPVYQRLVEVKTAYDPDNVFHHNQNIAALE